MSFQLGGHFSGGTILAGEQWVTPSETRYTQNYLVDMVRDGNTSVAEAMVP